jgi:hypothetical protein
MTKKVADNFFNDIDFVSIVSNIKGIYSSDGTMSILMDFERVLDDADLYAFKNWHLGELVQGPNTKRYSVTCVFMWPYKLMPDPKGALRLTTLGCKVSFATGNIKVPVQVTNYDDLIPGTNYPRSVNRKVWFVRIEIPIQLMNEIKEGSIDLADQEIDLAELDQAYDEDLDKADLKQEDAGQAGMQGDALGPPGDLGGPVGGPPPAGAGMPPGM